MSIRFVAERLVAEVKQHRVVLPLKPTTEDCEAAVLWPTLLVGPPSCQLLDEDLSTQLPQGFMDIAFRVTFGDKVDCRILRYRSPSRTTEHVHSTDGRKSPEQLWAFGR